MSVALLIIGLAGIIIKHNLVKVIIGIEIMTSSATINFVVFSLLFNNGMIDAFSQTIGVIIISISAVVVAVGLSLVVKGYYHYKSLHTKKMSKLKG